MTLEERITIVRAKIERAAQKSGRSGRDITIVAVTKGVSPGQIADAHLLGLHDFGENRVQEAKAKIPGIQIDARWHMIGHLQSNKARQALMLFSLIHSLDSEALGREIQKNCERLDIVARTLVQVNVSGEVSKHGVRPSDLDALLRELQPLDRVFVDGLMTIAPYTSTASDVRPVFADLARMSVRVQEKGLPRVNMRHLSMGMSGDFEVAIEEGANMVRIGTAIFGPRPPGITV